MFKEDIDFKLISSHQIIWDWCLSIFKTGDMHSFFVFFLP